MSTGVGLIVGVGALLAVLYLNRRSEQVTAMQAAKISNAKNSAGLGAGDLLSVGAVSLATYLGGPAAGQRVYAASGIKL